MNYLTIIRFLALAIALALLPLIVNITADLTTKAFYLAKNSLDQLVLTITQGSQQSTREIIKICLYLLIAIALTKKLLKK
ncbi:hypothetical protein [Desulfovulcanus sp.]